MELSKQVVSLELAQKLKELGVKQESLFWWRLSIDQSGKEPAEWYVSHWEGLPDQMHYSAFTVAELGNVLSKTKHQGDLIEAYVRAMDVTFSHASTNIGLVMCNVMTEPDIAAKMLIYLLENHLI